ncbi:hypothetical protein PINS_up004529 [Pythium insidiosum]|nr:hypothetical protein PINS_up004529 [Pythium insidiosum]
MTSVFIYAILPLSWSRIVATIAAVCMFVPVNLTLLVMRFDMIALLMRTYEFWYLTVINALCTVLLGVEYLDPRGLAIAVGSIAVQNGIMADANYRVVKTVAFWSTIAAVLYGGMAIAELLNALPDVRRLRIVRHGRWSVESNEVNANGLLTIAVIMMRNAYRRYAFVSTVQNGISRVRLVSYRTYVRFEAIALDARAVTPVVAECAPSPVNNRIDPTATQYQQLQLAPSLPVVHARQLLGGGFARHLSISPRARRLVSAFGVAGVTSSLISLSLISFGETGVAAMAVAHIAVTTSTLFAIITTGHLNTQLLRLLSTSFDPIFIFVQVLGAHVAVAILVDWRPMHCLVIACSCLWSTWIITSDALTPVVRLKLGLPHAFDAAVVVTLIMRSVLMLVLLYRPINDIRDRALFSLHVNGRTVQVSATSFVFTRILMLVMWWFRIAWRLRHLGHDGLVLLQGAVELEDTELLLRTARTSTSIKKRRGWRRRVKPIPRRDPPVDTTRDPVPPHSQ